MLDPGAYFLQQIKLEDKRMMQLKRFIQLSLSFSFLFLFVLAEIIGGTPIQLFLFSVVALVAILTPIFSSKKAANDRLDSLLALLEVDPEIFEHSSRRDLVMDAALSGAFETVQVSKNQQRTRGSDEKGFTSGKIESQLSNAIPRRDASISESAYVGLEDNLRPSELLVTEANLRYEAMAQKRWEDSESADVDLVEAGVERLGDLVQTDWFEKNAKEGVVQALMDSVKDEDEL